MASQIYFWLTLAASCVAQTKTVRAVTFDPSLSISISTSSATYATVGLSVDDLWNIWVGPVSTAAITTTVEATPISSASLIPPPPLYYPPYFAAQLPHLSIAVKNESWSFPAGFWWGVAGASYQVEGAVKDEGRGPSIWDVLSHRVPNFIADNSTGDVATNEYYLYKQGIARVAAMGVRAYSFSLSWPRIFPFGSGQVNEQALKHYDDVIDTCIKHGIQPIVTLYHWDLPLFLQNTYGGWLSGKIIPDFTEYARVVFTRWGSKVPHWFTVNEPSVFCGRYPLPDGYFKATSIPKQQQRYVCGHNVILAHASAYHLGKSLNITGTISFKNNGGYKIQATDSAEGAIAVQRAWDFTEGWWANPIFINGDYPQTLKDYVSTFLPEFTPEQKATINGSADIFAHDAYTGEFVMPPPHGIDSCLHNPADEFYPQCYRSSHTYPSTNTSSSNWLTGPAADQGSFWLFKATEWVPNMMHYIQDTWRPKGGIAIVEFGFSEPFEGFKERRDDILMDEIRRGYYRDYLRGVMVAIAEGVSVVGCLAWSYVDNWEWDKGFSTRFGLQYVNYATQERVYKASFFEYANVFKTYQKHS